MLYKLWYYNKSKWRRVRVTQPRCKYYTTASIRTFRVRGRGRRNLQLGLGYETTIYKIKIMIEKQTYLNTKQVVDKYEAKRLRLSRVMCLFFGHKWRYNFPISSTPNKAICEKCYAKSELNLRTLEWKVVSDFENEKRTDKELANKWF